MKATENNKELNRITAEDGNEQKAEEKMEPLHRLLIAYILEKRRTAAVFIVSMLFFYLVCLLYQLENMVSLYYAFFLWAFSALCFAVYGFIRYVQRYRTLFTAITDPESMIGLLPDPQGNMEQQYRQMISALTEELRRLRTGISAKDTEMTDYYTMWAHQIKVPISAMKLLLQSEKISDSSALLAEELFKIEQYAEMALYYQKLDSITSDFLFKKYDLYDIVKQALKKYAIFFINSKLSLDLQEFSRIIVTDEKWLQFAIGQILSNAIKYTPSGGISIRLEPAADADRLIIKDTGIGIRPEDLPRIFVRGFTGYNGRLDKKSTGIGLYLCRKILDKLSHTIEVTSEYGKGTTVAISFSLTKM
jgi:signal transduction histidine kinase